MSGFFFFLFFLCLMFAEPEGFFYIIGNISLALGIVFFIKGLLPSGLFLKDILFLLLSKLEASPESKASQLSKLESKLASPESKLEASPESKASQLSKLESKLASPESKADQDWERNSKEFTPPAAGKNLFKFGVDPTVEIERPDILVVKDRKKFDKTNGVWCGKDLNGENLFVSTEDRGLVFGPPSTGKTAYLINQLMQWIETGRSFIALDIKPEILAILRYKLDEHGYNLISFNPTYEAGYRYNMIDDLFSSESVSELANYFIPSDIHNVSNETFFSTARKILDATISHLRVDKGRTPTLKDVFDFVGLFDKPTKLINEFKNSQDEDVRFIASGLSMTAGNDRLISSILSAFRDGLDFLRHRNIRNSLSESEFSLSDLKRGKTALILQFVEEHKKTTEQLLTIFVNHILNYFIVNKDRDEILIVLDEIGNVPPITGLVEKLNTIRSRKLPTWMYFQTIHQMSMYGRTAEEGLKIMAACDCQQVFRVNDNSTAKVFSEGVGTVDRIVKSKNVTSEYFLFFELIDRVNESVSYQREDILFPHEFREFEQGYMLMLYRGEKVKCYAEPYFEVHKEYVDIKFNDSELIQLR